MTDETNPSIFLARLVGTQEQMGAQHGALSADDAKRLAEFYKTMPRRTLAGGLDGASQLVIDSIATAWQARLASDRPAEYAARTKAFVEAAAPGESWFRKRRFAHTMATMDSMQNTLSLIARLGLGPFAKPRAVRERREPAGSMTARIGELAGRLAAAPAALASRIGAKPGSSAVHACSSLIAWGRTTVDGELAFARNFDFPGVGVWDAAPSFIVCVPDSGQRYGYFASRGADACVVTVVNEAGLVLAPHTRYHLGVTWGGAMIVDLVHEIARKAETLDDAIRIARERPTSSSWGLAVGSAREKSGLVLELAGKHLEIVRPRQGEDFLTCANRYRSEAMQADQIAGSAAWAHNSDGRQRCLQHQVETALAASKRLTPTDMLRFLGARHDLHAPERTRHFGSILAQQTNVHCVSISPLARTAWVGIDRAPCCEGTVAELSWEWAGDAGGWQATDGHAAHGFTTRTRRDVVPAHHPATPHVRDAVRAFEQTHDVAFARAAIDRAIAAAPDDPSLHTSAAWLAAEAGDAEASVAHVRAALALETQPYRRTQLIATGARMSRDPAAREAWLAELDGVTGPEGDELRRFARRKSRLRVNLLMADAF